MLRIKSLKKSYKTQTQEDENDSDDNDGFVIRLQSFSWPDTDQAGLGRGR